jgi:hypothetical protein
MAIIKTKTTYILCLWSSIMCNKTKKKEKGNKKIKKIMKKKRKKEKTKG